MKIYNKIIYLHPQSNAVFESRVWYKEVSTIVILFILITYLTSLFIPYPFSILVIFILHISVLIWRIRIKAVTLQEATTIYLIWFVAGTSAGSLANFLTTSLYSLLISYPLTVTLLFLIIQLFYKRAKTLIDN